MRDGIFKLKKSVATTKHSMQPKLALTFETTIN
jgi:hypothetical protein